MTDMIAPEAVYSIAQIRQLEALAQQQLALSAHDLIARAAAAALQLIGQQWPHARSLVICCGPGHNGDDGRQLALQAAAAGYHVECLQLPVSGAMPQAAPEKVLAAGLIAGNDCPGQTLPAADIYVDALFGIGLNRPLPAVAESWVEAINRSGRPVLALDCPAGLHADTGVAEAVVVRATATLCFLAATQGLVTGQAQAWVGRLYLADLGLTAAVAGLTPQARALPWPLLAPRIRTAHKGQHGHLLLIGGDHGTAGAVHLAASAALRCGAGLVSVASRQEQVLAFNIRCPEVMAHGVNGPPALEPLLARASGVAVGPGLGQTAWGHALWLAAIESDKPLVVDADGLNLLARQTVRAPRQWILTPHPGEAARLLGTTTATIEADRYHAVRALAQRYQAVVVLKGAGSLVADPAGQVSYCRWGNPGMASGGMGDTLTGIIASLLVQGYSCWEAATRGVAIHALAGDRAAQGGERGLVASDLLPELRSLVNGGRHD